jgi:PAS domain-containing protein
MGISILEVVEIFSGVVAIITSLGIFITKKVIKPLKNITVSIQNNTGKLENVTETLIKHSALLKELEPNGGGSVKDHIKKISDNMDEVYLTIDQLIKVSQTQLDLVPYAIWQSNAEGKNIFINDAYKELFEIDFESVKDYKWMSLIHLDDVDTYIDLWNKTLKYKTDVTIITKVVTHRTKTIIRCKIYWKVTVKPDGTINYITGKIKRIDPEKMFPVKNS